MTLAATWARLSLRAKSLLVLSIPLVPLLIATAAIIATAGQQRAAQRMVEHTLQVKELIASSLQVTIDAEAAVQDFWISRSVQSSERLRSSLAAWPDVSARLIEAVSDNPIQRAHALRAQELRDERPLIALRDYLIEHPDAMTPPSEMLEDSRRTIAGLRQQLDEMQRVEDRLLIERGDILRRAEARVLRTAFFGALAGVIGGVVCSLAFSREISRRLAEVGDNAFRLLRNHPLRYLRPSEDEIGRLGHQLQELWGLTADRIRDLDRAKVELDQFFSVSLDMLCMTNLDGRFVRINPAWTATLGWTADELLDQPVTDLVHHEDVERTRRDLLRQSSSTEVAHIESRFRCRDGSYRWLSWKSTSRPEFGLIYAAVRDVTEQRRITAELESRVNELRELNQELESFTYSVSHDLRAPLRHVSGFNGFIERSASSRLTEQERRWLMQSVDAAQRMGRLIDDLLAFSKVGRTPVARNRVALDAVVRDAHEEVTATFSEPRHIDWSIHALPEIHGDADLLRRVFVNLLDNAIKYTKQQPRAVIEIGALPHRDGQAVVFVRDNGVGFDMQYAHKLFGVFQRLHAQEDFEGTGIGLANVRRIIVRHGGQTWAEGAIGEGATFYVSLPLAGQGVAA